MGLSAKSKGDRVTSIEVLALIFSVLWLVVVALFFLVLEPGDTSPDSGGALRWVMVLMAVFLPIALIWVAATTVRSSLVMREFAT